MTFGEYRRQLKKTFKVMFGEDSVPLCEVLLCEFTGLDPSGLLLAEEKEVPKSVMNQMGDAITELGMGVPVQYIIGSCYFYGLKIYVGKGCFIPRSDTENLVKTAIASIPQNGCFCDICSGSGCIPVAIAVNRPDIRGFALELSYRAMEYAEKNLDPYKNITLRRFDALDADDYNAATEQNGGKFDVVTCNPPYIRRDDIPLLSQQVQYEPTEALDGGDDGLDYYRFITANARLLLKDGGILMYEIGYLQADEVSEIMKQNGFETAVVRDLNGKDRVIIGKIIDN